LSEQPNDNYDLKAKDLGKGKVEFSIGMAGKPLHIDQINPAQSRDRKKFIKMAKEQIPGLDEGKLDSDLIIYATNFSNKPPSAREPDDLEEMDTSRIARPEQFYLPEVSGLAIPAIVKDGGQPVGKWYFYFRWADGRRERRELTNNIQFLDGSWLWIHPVPGEPSLTTDSSWAKTSRQEWLSGKVSPNPTQLFQGLCERFQQFLEFPVNVAAGTTATLALWTMLTYLYRAWPAVPYLYIGGPTGSGKSRLMEIFSHLCFRPFKTDNVTGASLFRTLHDRGGVVLFDEAERLKQSTPDQEDIRGLLLAGYRRGGQASRLEPVGDSFKTIFFDVYGPKALACIAGLPPALASRCIPISMFRSGPDSVKPKRRLDADPESWERLRNDLHFLALEHGSTWLELSEKSDVCPSELTARNYELWQPLLSLAWWLETQGAKGLLEIVKVHAISLMDLSREDQTNEADEILLEILTEHVQNGQFPTAGEILKLAKERDNATFDKWSSRGVSSRLKAYGIRTKKSKGKKVFRDVTMPQLRQIQMNYGIDLGISNEEKAPSGTFSDLPYMP
jgi:hypothetical protein